MKLRKAIVIFIALLLASSVLQLIQIQKVYADSTGLVMWLPFSEGTGTITADLSGYGNNGTITGASWVDGKYGRALNFNGSAYVSVVNTASLQPSIITVSAWVYPTDNSTYFVVASKTADDYTYGWEMANSNGILRVTLRNPILDRSAGILALNTWNFCAFTYNGTILRLYLNGVEVGNATGTATLAGANPFVVGARYSSFDDKFKGSIDEVRIYNRALTQDEIISLYNNNYIATTISLSASTSTSWNELNKWVATIGLSGTITSSWSFAPKWTATTTLTQTITSTWTILSGLQQTVDLTLSILSSWAFDWLEGVIPPLTAEEVLGVSIGLIIAFFATSLGVIFIYKRKND